MCSADISNACTVLIYWRRYAVGLYRAFVRLVSTAMLMILNRMCLWGQKGQMSGGKKPQVLNPKHWLWQLCETSKPVSQDSRCLISKTTHTLTPYFVFPCNTGERFLCLVSSRHKGNFSLSGCHMQHSACLSPPLLLLFSLIFFFPPVIHWINRPYTTT